MVVYWGSIAYIKRLLVYGCWVGRAGGNHVWCLLRDHHFKIVVSPAKHRIWSRHGNENCSHSTFSNCYVHVLQIRSCLLFSPCFLAAFKDMFLTFHQLKGRWIIYRKGKPQHRLGHPLAQVKSGKVGKVVEVPRGPASFLAAEMVQQWNSLKWGKWALRGLVIYDFFQFFHFFA